MLITLNAKQEDIVITLPQLYVELKNPEGDPLNVSNPCLTSLVFFQLPTNHM